MYVRCGSCLGAMGAEMKEMALAVQPGAATTTKTVAPATNGGLIPVQSVVQATRLSVVPQVQPTIAYIAPADGGGVVKITPQAEQSAGGIPVAMTEYEREYRANCPPPEPLRQRPDLYASLVARCSWLQEQIRATSKGEAIYTPGTGETKVGISPAGESGVFYLTPAANGGATPVDQVVQPPPPPAAAEAGTAVAAAVGIGLLAYLLLA